MAEADIDPTVIKRTQEILGKYIKKPPLTEKLLKKPPFRFLYDVIIAVIKDTGYFEGLYSAEELNFDNIKDREAKMSFLQKLIDVIKITTKTETTVRTSKIVAGHEAEKTNELLQLIGQTIEKKLDWKAAVQQVKGGKTIEKTKAKSQDKPKDGKSKEKPKEKTKEKDAKVKETKSSTKTISPTTKVEKPTKSTAVATKEREKVAGKVTKDKVGKENIAGKISKDDAGEKKKATKTKESPEQKPRKVEQNASPEQKKKVTEKTASPQKTEVREEQKVVLEDNKITEQENIKEAKRRSAKEERRSSVQSNSDSKEQRRNSKNAEDIEKMSAEHLEKPALEVEKPKESDSRKSSASQQKQRKNSASGSRRSSANKTARSEHEIGQQHASLNNLETLNTLNEEEPAQTPVLVAKKSTEIIEAQNNNNDIKRESTFTRENSRDSNSTTANRPRTSLRPPSARPASARPGAPRRRDKNVEIILQPNDQVKMSNINIKLETFGDLDDDGENLVIIEDAANTDNITGIHEPTSNNADATNMGENDLEQHGHLVQQILETQKELVHQNAAVTNKNEKKSNTRQSSARNMNNLRDVIQNLTKSVNPFGKLMDFIPEDIDAMTLELTMWTDTYRQAESELKREKSLTESATEPMKNQLIQIEANIKEYVEMIDVGRTKILQNSEKIIKMLTDQ